MASTLLDRGTSCATPTATSFPSWQQGQSPTSAPTGAAWCVVPRCSIEFEKCTGGFKIHCKCDDEVACGTLQNLCRLLCDGCCTVSCCANGIQICQCSLTCGITKCEFTKDGCCISCTSGDKECCAILQSCCQCLSTCCNSGCCCYVCFNNTPVCCGTCA